MVRVDSCLAHTVNTPCHRVAQVSPFKAFLLPQRLPGVPHTAASLALPLHFPVICSPLCFSTRTRTSSLDPLCRDESWPSRCISNGLAHGGPSAPCSGGQAGPCKSSGAEGSGSTGGQLGGRGITWSPGWEELRLSPACVNLQGCLTQQVEHCSRSPGIRSA